MSKQNEFSDVRGFLCAIRVVLGDRGIVSACWNGEMLTVLHARPETGRMPYQLVFDDPANDYVASGSELIFEFAKRSNAHFAPSDAENAA